MAVQHLEQVLREAPRRPRIRSRAELLHHLTLLDCDRVGRIGEFYANPQTRTLSELLIDAEEDKYLRAVLAGILREAVH